MQTAAFRLLILIGLTIASGIRLAHGAESATLLRPLAFLAGSCWTGTFPDGRKTDTHCFEWVYDRHFLRDRHVVRGGKQPYEGETMYAWDAKGGHIVFTYWASSGGYSVGELHVRGNDLVFPERHVRGGRSVEIENIWRRTGADTYEVVVREKADGDWRVLWTMTMRREPSEAR